jgi:SAM-dependent methyltransferase
MKFDKYEKYGAYHWDEFDRETEYREHVLFVLEWVKEKSVLDVGAGDGLITKKLGAVGIDTSEYGVMLAIERGVDVSLGSAYNLPKLSYEAVYMGDVIEHLDKPAKALLEAKKVAPILYIVTPPKSDTLSDYHYQEWTPVELKDFVESIGYKLDGEIIIKKHRMYGRFVRV